MLVSWEKFRSIYYHGVVLIMTIILMAGILYSVAHHLNIKDSWEGLVILFLALIGAYILTPRLLLFFFSPTCPLCESKEIQCELILYPKKSS